MAAHSPAMLAAAERARQLATYDVALLLAGERELARLVARMIHDHSPRRRHGFAKIHCGALSSGQLELELFGGHAPGARRAQPGLLEWCQGGTLVLDEVDGLTLRLQAQLIHLLREKCYRCVGGYKDRPVNVRILATSDADLARAVEEGRFRGDLHARLNLFCLRLPPLRERWRLDVSAARYNGGFPILPPADTGDLLQ